MSDQNKLPGIPFDANNPQDLARLKAGWPLVQRDGTKFEAEFLGIAKDAHPSYRLIFLHCHAVVLRYAANGKKWDSGNGKEDLFFASNKVRKSKWVAVVRAKSGYESTWTSETKDGLLSCIKSADGTILSGPVELAWEEDAPLPPVEQPKAGWYVGPFATQEIAMVNTHRTPTYGTLTEVQP